MTDDEPLAYVRSLSLGEFNSFLDRADGRWVIAQWPERGEEVSGAIRGVKYSASRGQFSMRLVADDRTAVVRWHQRDWATTDEFTDHLFARLGHLNLHIYFD